MGKLWQVIHIRSLYMSTYQLLDAIICYLQHIWKHMKFLKNNVLAFVSICYCNIKNCKVFLYIPHAWDPKDMHSNQVAKSENFLLTLPKKVSWTDVWAEANSDALSDIRGSRHGLTRHSESSTGLYAIQQARSCLKAHTFKSNSFLASTIFRRLDSRLIKRWKWHFIPLSWNAFSLTSSLGGAGGGAGGFGLNFGFSTTFSGSGSWKNISGVLVYVYIK